MRLKIKNIRYTNLRWVILALALAIFIVNITRLDFTMPFTSDGVYVQNFITVLQHHVHQVAIFDEDNYLAKAPFYWVLMHIGFSPHAQLLITLITFTFFSFALFYLSITLLNKQRRWFRPIYFDLGFLYLVSLSRLYEYMMIPNTRNIEIGISFLLLVPIMFSATKRLSYWLYGITILTLGILLFNDPYYLYAMYLPLFILLMISLLLTKKLKSKQIIPLTIIGSGYILFKVIAVIATKLNIFLGQVVLIFVPIAKFFINFKATIVALLLLGGAVYAQGRFHSVPTSFAYNGVIIACLMIFSLIYILANLKYIKKDPWKLFLVGLPLIISTLYVLQPVALNNVYRYILIASFGFPIIIAIALQGLRKSNMRYGIALFILIAIFFNVQYATQALAVNEHPNQINLTVSQYISSLGLKKGYTDYWSGNINTFYSSGKIYFLPVVCTNGELQPMFWAVDSGEFTKVSVNKSFYLYDNKGFYTQGCDLNEVQKYYGPPLYIKKINSEYSVAVYNYDLSSKMVMDYPKPQPVTLP